LIGVVDQLLDGFSNFVPCVFLFIWGVIVI